MMKILVDFLIFVFASTFTTNSPVLLTNQVVSIGILIICVFIFYKESEHYRDQIEFTSLLELVKTSFAKEIDLP